MTSMFNLKDVAEWIEFNGLLVLLGRQWVIF